MKTCYKCEKCGMVFDDYTNASEHENKHFIPKTWVNDDDQKVINDNTEWIPELYAPSAVVIPMERMVYIDSEWKTEVSYVKYYYGAKKTAEEVFSVDESLIKDC